MAPQPEQHPADRHPQEVAPIAAEAETAQEAERAAARRRSTVREKVSFMANAQPDAAAPVSHNPPQPPTAAPTPAEPASEAIEGQPRRAGWWSRRFGNGE
jgi:ribonuclease E